MPKSFKEYRAKALQDAEVQTAYEALEEEYSLAQAIIQARRMSGLTQEELAQRMGTKQSVIARLESGKRLPSSQTLHRVAQATGTRLTVRFITRTQRAAKHRSTKRTPAPA